MLIKDAEVDRSILFDAFDKKVIKCLTSQTACRCPIEYTDKIKFRYKLIQQQEERLKK